MQQAEGEGGTPAEMEMECDAESRPPSNKRVALRQCLVSRYHEEFHEVCKLGSGEFGDVFKCINRLDGCTYAIKRSKRPIAGSALEVAAWKEVCAHAALVKHSHIVHYYSAWAEADRMLIQSEYCNGGSLGELVESLRQQQTVRLAESDLRILLRHVAKGLAFMHSRHLAHLDIKPQNIFICRSHRFLPPPADVPRRRRRNEESGIESEGIEEDEDEVGERAEMGDEAEDELMVAEGSSVLAADSAFLGSEASPAHAQQQLITFKIGDLGHVSSTLEPHVEEGDCRFLSAELLHEQYEHLAKADIFALALTVFVAGSLAELPKNGEQWHWIRRGNLALSELPQCGERLRKLLLHMVSENAQQRPSAAALLQHPCVCPDAAKSKAQLRRELNAHKFKVEVLQRKVRHYEQQMQNACTTARDSHAAGARAKFTRSISFSFV